MASKLLFWNIRMSSIHYLEAMKKADIKSELFLAFWKILTNAFFLSKDWIKPSEMDFYPFKEGQILFEFAHWIIFWDNKKDIVNEKITEIEVLSKENIFSIGFLFWLNSIKSGFLWFLGSFFEVLIWTLISSSLSAKPSNNFYPESLAYSIENSLTNRALKSFSKTPGFVESPFKKAPYNLF